MAQFTTDQLKTEIEKNIKAFSEEWMGRGLNPINAIKEQAAQLRNFQEQVTKQITETKSLLDRAKDFLKDPKGEGIKIVKDGFKAADKFFANLFKLLTKDVGTVIKNLLKDLLSKITTNFDKFLKKILTTLSQNLTKIGQSLLKSENKLKQAIAKSLGSVVTSLNKSLANWGKSSGLIKAAQQIPKISSELAKSSKTLSALKDLPKAMGTLVRFATLFGKVAPIISSFVDLKWKNDVTNELRNIERKIRLDASVSDRQFNTIMNAIRKLESGKGGTELGTIARNTSDVLSEIKAVNAAVRQGSSKSDAIQASINRVGAQNYGPQLQSIQSTLNTVSAQTRQGPQQKDYSSQLAAISSALGTLNARPQTPSTPIDYSKVQQSVQQALSTFKPAEVKIPSDLARKSDLADLAKKSDVAAIPDKVKQPDLSQNFSQILNAVTTVNGSIVRLGADISRNTVNLQPLQQQLTSLSGQIASLPGTVANNVSNNIRSTVTNLGNTITNSVSNIITNNNQTIVNNIGKGLDPLSIINPIKSHINTEVAAPLKTTMKVLNVNDLEKGLSISGETLIKQSGFQQFGSTGSSTVTNLLGLTAAIAAPIFMRAGFHQLGTEFPKDMRNPQGEKTTPTTALGMSQWQFNQVTNLVGMPTKHLVKDASGGTTQKSFQNQSHAVEEIHAQNLGIEQDVSAIEKYCFYLLQNQEMMIQMILQNKYDIDVLIDESGAKTKQKIIQRPGIVSHTKDSSFFDNLMTSAMNHMVVREWQGDIDAKQLALKTNMEAQIAALSNKFEFDKTNPTLPIVDRQKQNPRADQDEEWKRYVNTSENPGSVRQSPGMPIPEIKEIKYGSDREVAKPTKDPSKLLGS